MFRYEVLMLTVPDITKDEAASVESQLDTILQQHKGSLISFERWGKYRLAYPIDKNDYGIYCLARFDTLTKDATLNDIRILLGVKLENSIMRFVITLLDPSKPTTYQRPPSLEEAPAKSASSFLKERGFINDNYDRRGRSAGARYSVEEKTEIEEQEPEIA